MINEITWGRRFVRHSLLSAAIALTCAALRADHEAQHGSSAEMFIQKAAAGGQMEVQMGRIAQSQAQSQEVKSLGSTLVRDHTQANQKLQQLAQSKNIQIDRLVQAEPLKSPTGAAKDQISTDLHGKYQRALEKLQSQSGAEFDKSFVTIVLKDHKKDIAEFEKARTELTDPEIKAFIDETLPTLRNHLQLAQGAARTIGVDENAIRTDNETPAGVGAPASSTRGGYDKTTTSPGASSSNSSIDNSSQVRPNSATATDSSRQSYPNASGTAPTSPSTGSSSSSIDNSSQVRPNSATDTDSSGTTRQYNSNSSVTTPSDSSQPGASVNANVGGQEINAQASVNNSDASVSSSSTGPNVSNAVEHHSKFFQKGDHKVLGLSTDKHDGKFWGFIPNPRAKNTNP